MEILSFFVGIILSFFFKNPIIYAYFLVFFFRPRWTWFISILIGCLWGFLHQYILKNDHMPEQAVFSHAIMLGDIASIPQKTGEKVQFEYRLRRINKQIVHTSVLMTCYDHCPTLHPGERWRFIGKLKKPRNLQNPGGYNYIAHLASRHIAWTGYVQRNTFHKIKSNTSRYWVLRSRAYLADRLSSINNNDRATGIIQGLTLGITNAIDHASWDLFRRTGTTHLMVISGSHIGLIVGIIYALFKWFWVRCGSLCLWCPAPKIASAVSLLFGCIYTVLAGFGTPAQRSLICCFFMLLRNFSNKEYSVWQGWRYALLGVLIFEPHSVLMPGFYLSFLAVVALIVVNQLSIKHKLLKIIVLQCSCFLGLMPLTLYWFSYASLNGFIANLVAIPWVSFVIVPLSLLSLFVTKFSMSAFLMHFLNANIDYLYTFLFWIDQLEYINLTYTFTHIVCPVILLFCMGLFVAIQDITLLPILFLCCIASLLPKREKIDFGNARVDVLDVGQGLAIVVRTAHHLLIYDTGAKFFNGGDMGKLALIPYLKTLSISEINAVIISHPDLDHRGGLRSLEEIYPVKKLIVDNPVFYHKGYDCHHYPAWTWDGVRFRFFPILTKKQEKNNRSCVLQIGNALHRILLPGDIEKPAETYLSQRYGNALASSVMVVPHHGSKTSSSESWLRVVSPKYVIASYGFDNRYHIPHAEVLKRYETHGIPFYATATCGMLSVSLNDIYAYNKSSCVKPTRSNNFRNACNASTCI